MSDPQKEKKPVSLLVQMFPAANDPSEVNRKQAGRYLSRSVQYSLYGEKKVIKSGLLTRGAWMTYQLFLERAEPDGFVRVSYEDIAGDISRTSLRRRMQEILGLEFLEVIERKPGRGKSVYRVTALPESWNLNDKAANPFVRLRQREFAKVNLAQQPPSEEEA